MLRGKTALVTGGARGNGAGIAEGLKKEGACVYVADLDKGKDVNIRYEIVDVTNKNQIDEFFEYIRKKGVVFDVLINCAGISISEPSEEYSMDKWLKTLSVNLTAPFYLSQCVAQRLIKNGKEGSIINITSLGAEFGFPDNPAYCASKGGLKQLTKAMAYDWAKYGIRVNNVGPGYIKTRMTEKSYESEALRSERSKHMMLNRWGEPRDLAGVCVFLASSQSAYITGQDIYVDGGWTAKGL